jgi:8-oxo-dGTP pyrophosphatase MutT (NUDIX family)
MEIEDNPWKILDEKTMYDNPWIQVTEFKVINPSGGQGIYGKVHFKNFAIGIVTLDDDWNTHLVGQFRFPINQYSWEIPEGGGAMNTDPVLSAKRELLEETGLIAKSWTKILSMHLSNSVSDEIAFIYLARELEQHAADPDETEKLSLQKIHLDDAFRMIETGVITDSISVAALQQLQIMIFQGKLKNKD